MFYTYQREREYRGEKRKVMGERTDRQALGKDVLEEIEEKMVKGQRNTKRRCVDTQNWKQDLNCEKFYLTMGLLFTVHWALGYSKRKCLSTSQTLDGGIRCIYATAAPSSGVVELIMTSEDLFRTDSVF